MKLRVPAIAISIAALLCAAAATAQPPRPGGPAEEREFIYGAELLTAGEREAYRKALGAATDEPARSRVRERHRERVQQRARDRGARLSEPHGALERKGGR